MWRLASVNIRNREEVEQWLSQGYEPFAVTQEGYPTGDRLWLRKEEKVVRAGIKQPRANKGASRTADSKPQE